MKLSYHSSSPPPINTEFPENTYNKYGTRSNWTIYDTYFRDIGGTDLCKMIEERDRIIKQRDDQINSLRNAIGNLKDMLRERNTELHELERAKGASNKMWKAVIHNAGR